MELQTIWWLNRTVRALPSVPSLAFVHVPVPEFMELWNKGLARGSKHEDVNCPMHDSGLFRAAKEMNITALYSGHDHDNNYEGVLDGVRLAYGHKTGTQPACLVSSGTVQAHLSLQIGGSTCFIRLLRYPLLIACGTCQCLCDGVLCPVSGADSQNASSAASSLRDMKLNLHARVPM